MELPAALPDSHQIPVHGDGRLDGRGPDHARTRRGDPRPMPTDHGPELEGLRKRLADAKEFL